MTSSFSIHISFCWFITLDKNSSAILNKSGEGRNPFLIPDSIYLFIFIVVLGGCTLWHL
jgi:hypothetical protein